MSRITVIRERLNSMQQDFDDWYQKADENGKAMGPAEIKHVALQQMADKMAQVDVIWDGLGELVPMIKTQTTYTVLKMGNSVTTLIPEIRNLYGVFNQFLESGPEENLSAMDEASIGQVIEGRREIYRRLSSVLHRNITDLYIATSWLRDAHVMLNFQMEIQGKTAESIEPEISSSEIRGLRREIQSVVDQLKQVRTDGEELTRLLQTDIPDYTRLGNSPSDPFRTLLPTRPDRRMFDRLYFKVALSFLTLLSSVHKAEPRLAELMVGLDKIIDENIAAEGGVRGTTLDTAKVAQDLHIDIERAYARLDSAANLAARDFQVDYTEADLIRSYGPVRDMEDIIRANDMVATNIRNLLNLVG